MMHLCLTLLCVYLPCHKMSSVYDSDHCFQRGAYARIIGAKLGFGRKIAYVLVHCIQPN